MAGAAIGAVVSAGTAYMQSRDQRKIAAKQEKEAQLAEKRSADEARREKKQSILQGAQEARRRQQRVKVRDYGERSLLKPSDKVMLG